MRGGNAFPKKSAFIAWQTPPGKVYSTVGQLSSTDDIFCSTPSPTRASELQAIESSPKQVSLGQNKVSVSILRAEPQRSIGSDPASAIPLQAQSDLA